MAERSKCRKVCGNGGDSDDEDWLREVHRASASSSRSVSSNTGVLEQSSSRGDDVCCTEACCADIDEHGCDVPTVLPVRVVPTKGT